MLVLQDADDCEAVDETRPSRRPAAKRRTRAAEVHNQSERVISPDESTTPLPTGVATGDKLNNVLPLL